MRDVGDAPRQGGGAVRADELQVVTGVGLVHPGRRQRRHGVVAHGLGQLVAGESVSGRRDVVEAELARVEGTGRIVRRERDHAAQERRRRDDRELFPVGQRDDVVLDDVGPRGVDGVACTPRPDRRPEASAVTTAATASAVLAWPISWANSVMRLTLSSSTSRPYAASSSGVSPRACSHNSRSATTSGPAAHAAAAVGRRSSVRYERNDPMAAHACADGPSSMPGRPDASAKLRIVGPASSSTPSAYSIPASTAARDRPVSRLSRASSRSRGTALSLPASASSRSSSGASSRTSGGYSPLTTSRYIAGWRR